MVMNETDRALPSESSGSENNECSKKAVLGRDECCGHMETGQCVRKHSGGIFPIGWLGKVTSCWWVRDSRGKQVPGRRGQAGKRLWVESGHLEGGAVHGRPWGNHRVLQGSLTTNNIGALLPLIASPSSLSSVFHLPC